MDGSYIAELALQEAVKLAKELRAQLRVMHVVDEVSLNWPDGGDFEEFKETFQTSSHKILEQADAEMHKMGVTEETKRIEIETFGHRVADMIAAEARRPHRHQVYLVRHGETAWSISGQHTGRTYIPLTERGEHAAQELSARRRC